MPITVADLVAKISADTSQFKGPMSEATKQLDLFEKQATSAAKKGGDAFAAAGKQMDQYSSFVSRAGRSIQLQSEALTQMKARLDALAASQAKRTAELDREIAANKRLEDAYRTLGVRSQASMVLMREKAQEAFKTIRDSGLATNRDLANSQTALRTLFAGLNADSTRLGTALRAAGSAFGVIQEGAAAAGIGLGTLGRVAGVAVGVMSGGTGVALGLAVGLGALTAAAIKAGDALAMNVTRVKEMVEVSGLSYQAANRLAGAMELMGQNATVLQNAFFRLDAEIGTGGAALDRLGVKLRDSAGNARSSGEVLLELRDRMSDIGDVSARNAVLLDQFGARLGRQLITMFAKTREEMEAFLQRAGELDGMNQRDVEMGKQLMKSKQEVALAWSGLSTTIGSKVAPAYIKINELLTASLKIVRDLIDEPSTILKIIDFRFQILGREASTVSMLQGLVQSAWEVITAPFTAGPLIIDVVYKVGRMFDPRAQMEGALPGPVATDVDATRGGVAGSLSDQVRLPVDVPGGVRSKFATSTEIKQAIDESARWRESVTNDIDTVLAKNQTLADTRQRTEMQASAVAIEQAKRRRDAIVREMDDAIRIISTEQITGRVQPFDELGRERQQQVVEKMRAQNAARLEAERTIQAEEAKGWKAREALSLDALRVVKSNLDLEIQARTHANEQATAMAEMLARASTTSAFETATQITEIQKQSAKERLDIQLAALENDRKMAQRQFNQPADRDKLNTELALIDNKARAARLDAEKAMHQTELTMLQAWADDAKAIRAAETSFEKEEADKQRAIFETLLSNRLAAQQDTMDRMKRILQDPGLDPKKRNELELALFLAGLQKKATAQETDWQRTIAGEESVNRAREAAYAASLTTLQTLELDHQERLSAIRIEAHRKSLRTQEQIDKSEFEQKLKTDADAFRNSLRTREVIYKEHVASLINMEVDARIAAMTTLEDVARDGALRMVRAQTEVLQNRNAFTLESQAALLAFTEASAIAAGDIGTAFKAMFAQTLIAGNDFWSSMKTLATDFGQAAQGALSDTFFGWMSGEFDSLEKAAASFWNSMKRAIANFLASTVVNELGQWFSSLLGLSSGGAQRIMSGVAQGLQQGANQAVGSTVLPDGSPGVILANGAVVPASQVSGGGGGGGGFNISSIPTGVFNPGMWSTVADVGLGLWGAAGGAGGALGPAFTGVGGIDVALAGGSLSEVGSAFSSAASGVSSLSLVVAYAAAAFEVFNSAMDIANGNLEAGIGGLVGGAILGAVGGYFLGPMGAAVGYVIGDMLGSWIGGLFGGPSGYEVKRMKAAEEAQAALGTVGAGYATAFKTGDLGAILGALSAGGGGAAGNSVRTELVLPSSVAERLGITGQMIGDQLVAQWSSLTLDQFRQVIEAFKQSPDLIQLIRGSGDVPYLEGGDAAAIAEQIKQGAITLLEAFIALEQVRDKINTTAEMINSVAGKVLPEDAATAFASKVNNIRDRMIAILTSGLPVEEMQKQMEKLQTEMQAYSGLMSLYAQVQQTQASLAGDLATQTQGAILAMTTSLEMAGHAITEAQKAADTALTPEAKLTAETALFQAVMGRYQMEMQMVQQIESAIASLYQNVGTPARANQIMAATFGLEQGDTEFFEELYHELVRLSSEGDSVARKLFAIGQGLALVVAGATESAKYFRTTPVVGENVDLTAPAKITDIFGQQAAPFFTALQGLITAAEGGGDFQTQVTLLQQQAEAIKGIGAAAITAVQEWAQHMIDETNRVADARIDEINKTYETEQKRINDKATLDIQTIEDARDARVESLELEVKGIQDATEARQEAIATEIKGIQARAEAEQEAIAAQIDALDVQRSAVLEQAQAAREWENVANSLGAMIQQLQLSDLAALNPADQFELAQSAFTRVQGEFEASPTAEKAASVQSAAQDLLQAGEQLYTRPSLQFQELYQRVVNSLEHVQGDALRLRGPVTAGDLEAQAGRLAERIDALRVESEAIGKRAQEQSARLQAESETLGKSAQKQIELLQEAIKTEQDNATLAIEAINKQKEQDLEIARKQHDDDIELVNKWRQAQIDAIKQTAETQIANIKTGMAAALEENSKKQLSVMDKLVGAQLQQLNEITKGVPVQTFMADRARETARLLGEIAKDIHDFLVAAGTTSAQSGANRTREGLYLLHDNEMVLPAHAADRMREMGGRRLLDQPIGFAAQGTSDWQAIQEQAEEAKRRRMHTYVFGGPIGYKENKNPLYVGRELSASFMESLNRLAPAARAKMEQTMSAQGWLTPAQANAERWKILQKMGWTGDVPGAVGGGGDTGAPSVARSAAEQLMLDIDASLGGQSFGNKADDAATTPLQEIATNTAQTVAELQSLNGTAGAAGGAGYTDADMAREIDQNLGGQAAMAQVQALIDAGKIRDPFLAAGLPSIYKPRPGPGGRTDGRWSDNGEIYTVPGPPIGAGSGPYGPGGQTGGYWSDGIYIVPSAAVGMRRVPRDMMVYAHQDEAILDVPDAVDWRAREIDASEPGGRSIGDLNITVQVDGDVSDVDRFAVAVAREVKRVLPDMLDHEARYGDLGLKITRRQKGL